MALMTLEAVLFVFPSENAGGVLLCLLHGRHSRTKFYEN